MEQYTLITGASSGIGYQLAKIFAKNGHNLILVGRHAESLNHVAQEAKALNVKAHVIAKDLFEVDNAFDLHDEVKAKGWKVNILVNNAGQGQYGLFNETDLKRVIQLNIVSLVALTKLFLQDMIAAGEGKILNTSSIASKVPGPYHAVYHATKAFVQSFTEAIRSEMKEVNENITITALLPGATDTDFFNKASMQKSKVVQDPDKLDDPADVAQDGYDALMAGKDMVISGAKNKMQVAMGAITPDSMAADSMKKQQEPVDKK